MTSRNSVGACTIRRAPRDLRWPGDRHVAVVFNVAYEAWSDGNASGIGPMGNPLPAGVFDTNADSYGRYGAQAGIRRLMDILHRAGVHANVFTSGVLAELLMRIYYDGGHARPYHTRQGQEPAADDGWHA